MKIVSIVGRELTKGEVESMKRFRSYTDGVSFACLREGVMVMIADEPSTDLDSLKEEAQERMEEALSENPDMTTWEMDDGYLLVGLPSGIFAVSLEPQKGDFGRYLALREECLEACANGEIIAIAYEEE